MPSGRKLTAQEEEKIYRLYCDERIPSTRLALRFGISAMTVMVIIRRLTQARGVGLPPPTRGQIR